MRTNKEKLDCYFKTLIEKQNKYLENVIPLPRPKVCYMVTLNGRIDIQEITDICVYIPDAYYSEKPTRKDIARIIEIAENYEMSEEDIRFHYKYQIGNIGEVSGAHKIKDFNENKNITFDIKIAEKMSKERKDKVAKEKELLLNGHIRCAYCNKVIDEKTAISHKIFFISNRQSRSSTNKYCNGTCAMHDQIAHEG